MHPDVFLGSIVDIAIGIAGFAGIIAAIQHRDLTAWSPRHRILLQILFFRDGDRVRIAPIGTRRSGITRTDDLETGQRRALGVVRRHRAVPHQAESQTRSPILAATGIRGVGSRARDPSGLQPDDTRPVVALFVRHIQFGGQRLLCVFTAADGWWRRSPEGVR